MTIWLLLESWDAGVSWDWVGAFQSQAGAEKAVRLVAREYRKHFMPDTPMVYDDIQDIHQVGHRAWKIDAVRVLP